MCQLTVSEVRESNPPFMESDKAAYFRNPEDACDWAETHGGKMDQHCGYYRVMKEKVA